MKNNPSDKVYTPSFIVDEVLDIFLPQVRCHETLLEPFAGEGAFFDCMPLGRTDWCEIDKDKDFFSYDKKVDWIITNPPYSIFKEILPKMLDIADNIVLVIPVNKLLSSMPRLMDIQRAGFGIAHIHYLGSGRQLKFPFGFPVGAVYLQKGGNGTTTITKGDTKITYADRCYKSKAKGEK